MKRVLITSTSVMAFYFFIPHIKALIDDGYEVEYACSSIHDFEYRLRESLTGAYKIPIHTVTLYRTPYRLANIKGYREIRKIINKGHYGLIITNEPVMGVVTRLAARTFRQCGGHVIYIAHGFHFFKGAPLINWLIYYPIERWMARYTDVLITINKEDFTRAECFKVSKVEYIPGMGIDIEEINRVNIDSELKRYELGIPTDAIVLLSVGELNHNKNHKIVLRALSTMCRNDICYVVCGQGPLEGYLKKLSVMFGIEKKVYFLGYRSDVIDICKISDIFIFPSLREGLGIAALEAMASGLPIITTNVHGVLDYSIDGKTGFVVKRNDIRRLTSAIEIIADNEQMRIKMGNYNKTYVTRFDISYSIKKMREIFIELVT